MTVSEIFAISIKHHTCIVFLCVLTFLTGSEAALKTKSAATTPLRDVRVEKLHIRSDVTYRFAITEVISEICNYANVSKEARFDVRLPKSAFISNFTMVIDGKEYAGEVEKKESARERYESARKQGQSAGYVGSQPRHTDRFKVAVNVAANSTVTFNLIYEDLLQRRLGLYELVVYIDPGQIVPDMRVDVQIVENREITELNIPNIRNDLITDVEIDANPYVEVTSQTDKSAHISFAPSPEEQRNIAENGISGQFIVNYDVKRDFKGGEILVSNGYFVHFFAPPDLDPMPKSIMFVLDVSGSMYVQKLKQLKDAMESILQDLNPEDDFNIVKFSSSVSMWKQDIMVPASDTLVEEAMKYTNSLIARGATNINDALLKTLEFTPFVNTSKVPMIFFLTDGNPTVGQTNNDMILSNVIKKNHQRKAAIFCLAFGSDADFDLVKNVASSNNGLARKIYRDADASLQLAGFYDEISAPVLSDVHIKYLDSALEAKSITKARSMNYFLGSEMIISGRMSDGANENYTAGIDLNITANEIDGSFVVDESIVPEVIDFNPATADRLLSITERMWAYLTIKQLLEDATYLDNQHLKPNLTSEALQLALKYSFVTELTAMVVIQPSTSNRTENITEIDDDYYVTDLMRQDSVPVLIMRTGGGSGHRPKNPKYRRKMHQSIGPSGPSAGHAGMRPPGHVSGGGAMLQSSKLSQSRGRTGSSGHKHLRKGGVHGRQPAITRDRALGRQLGYDLARASTYDSARTATQHANTSRSTNATVSRSVSDQDVWEKQCEACRRGMTLKLARKDVSVTGVLPRVVKRRKLALTRYAFTKVTLTLNGSVIVMTPLRVKIDNTSLPWWRSAVMNQTRFQANMTSSKQLVVTTDDGFHLVVSRVGLRSRRSRTKPYLSVDLLDEGSLFPNQTQGAFPRVRDPVADTDVSKVSSRRNETRI